jgi:hypothetical protein
MDKFDLAVSIAALRNSGPMDDALIGLPLLADMLALTWRLELSEASKLMINQLQECSDELPLYRRYANSRPVLLSTERTPVAGEDYPGWGHKFYPSDRDRALADLPLACLSGHRLGEPGTHAEGARSLGLVLVAALHFFDLDRPPVSHSVPELPRLWPLAHGAKLTTAHFEDLFERRHLHKMLDPELVAIAGRTRQCINEWIGAKEHWKTGEPSERRWTPSPELLARCGLPPLQSPLQRVTTKRR